MNVLQKYKKQSKDAPLSAESVRDVAKLHIFRFQMKKKQKRQLLEKSCPFK